MKKVQRQEIIDYVTYDALRNDVRVQLFREKEVRRIHVGDYLTFLFENTTTIRYQIQEMVRAEKIVKEADIRHEIDTYNEILGEKGELGCTLLIEIADEKKRPELLVEWRDLPSFIYVGLSDGRRVNATFDTRQIDETRLSSVQFLKFQTHGEVPSAIGVNHPRLSDETKLSPLQTQAFSDDLSSSE